MTFLVLMSAFSAIDDLPTFMRDVNLLSNGTRLQPIVDPRGTDTKEIAFGFCDM
jgi:hypothetical protein